MSRIRVGNMLMCISLVFMVIGYIVATRYHSVNVEVYAYNNSPIPVEKMNAVMESFPWVENENDFFLDIVEVSKNTQKAENPQVQPKKPDVKMPIVVDTTNILNPSGVTEEEFSQILKRNGRPKIASWAKAYTKAEKTYGVNALFIASVTIAESGDMQSNMAVTRNNPLGLAAYDYNLNAAIRFKDMGEAIMYMARLMVESDFYTKGGRYSVEDISTSYCNHNQGWINSVKSQMVMFQKLGNEIR